MSIDHLAAPLTAADVRRVIAFDRAMNLTTERRSPATPGGISLSITPTVDEVCMCADAVHAWLFPDEETP